MDRLKSLSTKQEPVSLDTSVFIYYLESNPLLGRLKKNQQLSNLWAEGILQDFLVTKKKWLRSRVVDRPKCLYVLVIYG